MNERANILRRIRMAAIEGETEVSKPKSEDNDKNEQSVINGGLPSSLLQQQQQSTTTRYHHKHTEAFFLSQQPTMSWDDDEPMVMATATTTTPLLAATAAGAASQSHHKATRQEALADALLGVRKTPRLSMEAPSSYTTTTAGGNAGGMGPRNHHHHHHHHHGRLPIVDTHHNLYTSFTRKSCPCKDFRRILLLDKNFVQFGISMSIPGGQI
jgi:hypothetical protein